ncbi:MAG: oligosaccharide flippase family protein, partial [Hyphomonadaceae bacterium]|nr:oligosaccharide flippase family protein [Hyphomonadaceae bacterium]
AMLALCSVAALCFFMIAGLYATIVRTAQVSSILEMLSLTMLTLPFVVGPMAIMRQRLDFKGLALLGMISSFAGSLAALATAYTPLLEWSLVVQRFVTSITMILIATMRTRSLPGLGFDVQAARIWFAAAWRIFAGQGIASATPRAVDLMMGFFFGVVALGYLRIAARLADLALNTLVNPIGQLWVVLLSKAKDSADERRRIFLQLSSLTALISLPGFAGLALVSHEIFSLLLPAEYAPAAPLLTVMCALMILAPLTNPRNSIFTALRKFNFLVWFAALDFVATIVGMLAMSVFGAAAMLTGSALASILLIALALPIILRSMDADIGEYAKKLAPPYIAVGVMCAVIIAMQPYLAGMPPHMSLLIKATTGAVVYVGVLGVLFRTSVRNAIGALAGR